MAIKVIVEFRARAGRRDDLKALLESVAESNGPQAPGFLGSVRYEVLEDPDALIEIADWESAEKRAAAMEVAMTSGAYAPLSDLLAAELKATAIAELP